MDGMQPVGIEDISADLIEHIQTGPCRGRRVAGVMVNHPGLVVKSQHGDVAENLLIVLIGEMPCDDRVPVIQPLIRLLDFFLLDRMKAYFWG